MLGLVEKLKLYLVPLFLLAIFLVFLLPGLNLFQKSSCLQQYNPCSTTNCVALCSLKCSLKQFASNGFTLLKTDLEAVVVLPGFFTFIAYFIISLSLFNFNHFLLQFSLFRPPKTNF
jgi:hypothetical protein